MIEEREDTRTTEEKDAIRMIEEIVVLIETSEIEETVMTDLTAEEMIDLLTLTVIEDIHQAAIEEMKTEAMRLQDSIEEREETAIEMKDALAIETEIEIILLAAAIEIETIGVHASLRTEETEASVAKEETATEAMIDSAVIEETAREERKALQNLMAMTLSCLLQIEIKQLHSGFLVRKSKRQKTINKQIPPGIAWWFI